MPHSSLSRIEIWWPVITTRERTNERWRGRQDDEERESERRLIHEWRLYDSQGQWSRDQSSVSCRVSTSRGSSVNNPKCIPRAARRWSLTCPRLLMPDVCFLFISLRPSSGISPKTWPTNEETIMEPVFGFVMDEARVHRLIRWSLPPYSRVMLMPTVSRVVMTRLIKNTNQLMKRESSSYGQPLISYLASFVQCSLVSHSLRLIQCIDLLVWSRRSADEDCRVDACNRKDSSKPIPKFLMKRNHDNKNEINPEAICYHWSPVPTCESWAVVQSSSAHRHTHFTVPLVALLTDEAPRERNDGTSERMNERVRNQELRFSKCNFLRLIISFLVWEFMNSELGFILWILVLNSLLGKCVIQRVSDKMDEDIEILFCVSEVMTQDPELRIIHGISNASWKICSLVVNGQSFLDIDGYLLNLF